jgi:hypothetical protein
MHRTPSGQADFARGASLQLLPGLSAGRGAPYPVPPKRKACVTYLAR